MRMAYSGYQSIDCECDLTAGGKAVLPGLALDIRIPPYLSEAPKGGGAGEEAAVRPRQSLSHKQF